MGEHIGDPAKMLSDARARIGSLKRRPSEEEYQTARRFMSRIDEDVVRKLEALAGDSASAGVAIEQFQKLQGKKQEVIINEGEVAKEQYRAVVDLEHEYRHLEALAKHAELALMGSQSREEMERRKGEEVERKLLADIQDAAVRQATTLDLSHREIEWLPEALGQLSCLVHVDLSFNRLKELPDAIGRLSALQELNLHGNELERLPDSIGLLQSLERLDISSNQIQELPTSLSNCRNLEELDTKFNQLKAVPESLGRSLPKLKRLVLALNKIRQLPKSIVQLQNLTHLDVNFNRLSKLPADIHKLASLEILDVGNNFSDLQWLPPALGDLAALRELIVANNQISELPAELGQLERLEALALEGNPWKDPPVEVLEQLTDIKTLKQFLAERLQAKRAGVSQPSGWSAWFASFFANLSFARWLGRLAAAMPGMIAGVPGAASPGGRAKGPEQVEAAPEQRQLEDAPAADDDVWSSSLQRYGSGRLEVSTMPRP